MTHERRIGELELEVKTLRAENKMIPVLVEQIAGLRRGQDAIEKTLTEGFKAVDARFDRVDEEDRSNRRTMIAYIVSIALLVISAAIGIAIRVGGA